MGNILTQKCHIRNGTQIEDMTYRYRYDANNKLLRNRLYHINDNIASIVDSTDIDDQGVFNSDPDFIETANNYVRDKMGRLVKDRQEEIDTVIWTASNKVKEIRRTFNSDKKNIIFDYDAMGNQIAKHVYNNQSLMLEQSTYYILDAQGNQLSIYEHSIDSASGSVYYYLTDRNIYGSSRLGVTKDTLNMFNPSVLQSYGVLGNRNYELTDHRGNVQTVINDIKYPLSSDNTSIDSYEVGINSVADYSPFGVELDGRTVDNIFHHPSQNNGSQTQADTVEIYNNDFDNPPATGSPYYSTEVTLDANLSNTKWTSSTGTFTNYNSSGAGSGKSIAISSASADTAYLTLSFDVENGYELDITSYSFAHRSSATGYTNYKLVVNGIEIGNGSIFVSSSGSSLQSTGVVNAINPVSGQMGPVNVVLKLFGGAHGSGGTFRMDDFVLNGFVQEESSGFSSSNYFVARNYRSSFQGQEHHDEIRGKGNYINYKYRGHDPRVGRLDWLVDPLAKDYPYYTPYQFSGNKLIHAIELEGLEEVELNSGEKIETGPRSIESTIDLLESMGTWDNGQYVTEWGDGVKGFEEISVKPSYGSSSSTNENQNFLRFDLLSVPQSNSGEAPYPGGKSLVPEISSDISLGVSLQTTMVDVAAGQTAKEMGKQAPKALITISRISGGTGGIVGGADNVLQTYNDIQKGNYGRATVNGTQAGAYLIGTAMLSFPGTAPVGATILLITTISDWIQAGIEIQTGANY